MANLKAKKTIWSWLKWVLIILALGGLIFWAFLPKPVAVEVATVQRGEFRLEIVEEGKTRAKEIYEIKSPVEGNLRRVPHKAGDFVKVGDLLAEVEWPQTWKIDSPVPGQILQIQRESGGPIQRGETIMEVANPTEIEVVAEILTEDAVSIKPGAQVMIENWGGCDDLLGKVRLVEPRAFTKVSALGIEEQRVNVIIDLVSEREKCQGLAHGFRVNTRTLIYEAQDVLTLPTGALFRLGEDWGVFQVVDGKAIKTPVKISHRNPERALVESGLKEGDRVIVYPSDQIDQGSKVEAMETQLES